MMLTPKTRSANNLPALSRRLFRVIPILFVILSLACSLPGLPRGAQGTPTKVIPGGSGAVSTTTPGGQPIPTEAPRPTPTPLPPALVESDPPPGSEIPLVKPITLMFNQPMNRASVEGALQGVPSLSGRFNWVDDATVTFVPDTPLLPETNVSITVTAAAQSQEGLMLINPLTIKYRTVGYLRLSQVLPEPDAKEVDPSSAIVAAFNRPVVPLGANPNDLPAGFSLEPEPGGHGEWINTSTYIYYPEPALVGGAQYTVRINQALTGADGSPLDPGTGDQPGHPLQWSFSTALPRLVSVEPGMDIDLARLDSKIVLTFNQAMDQESVKANFSVVDPTDQPVQGALTWSEDGKVLTFQPSGLLQRSTTYTIRLNGETLALGGTPLGTPLRSVFTTVLDLHVIASQPVQGGIKNVPDAITLNLSAHLPLKDQLPYINLEPKVSDLGTYQDNDGLALILYGTFEPDTAYTLTVSADLTDLWGDTLGEPFTLRFRTGALDPNLLIAQGYDLLYLAPGKNFLPAQATNISQATLTLGSVSFADFVKMLGPNGYDLRMNYQPAGARTWTQTLDLAANRSQKVDLDLTSDGSELSPGIYHLRVEVPGQIYQPLPYLLVVSRNHLTFKIGVADALVWAVRLDEQSAEGQLLPPVVDAPVGIYEENGSPLALGTTDSQGVFQAQLPRAADLYGIRYAMIGQPGDEGFALAVSTWSLGVEGWDFGLTTNYAPPAMKVYMYSDRPIYRPGQTVYFRAVARQSSNGRYSLPNIASLPVKVFDGSGQEQASFDLQLSGLGTVHGEYTIPPGAQPGYYRMGVQFKDEVDIQYTLDFQVANYRKPEINLQVSLEPASGAEEAQAGQPLKGRVNARYFFDAPASDVPLHWALYAQPDHFDLPGYQVGPEDNFWLWNPRFATFPAYGRLVKEGDARTGPDGKLAFDLPSKLELAEGDPANPNSRWQFTLEVTLQDESGLPVSGRDRLMVNPAPFYIGVRPDAWTAQAGMEMGFEVLAVDWEGRPAGEQSLRAEFRKVVWVRDETADMRFFGPTFTPQYTTTGQVDFVTGGDGVARLSFSPSEPGTYQLRVSGGPALTEITLWVGGAGQTVWPNLPNGRLQVTADRSEYQPGDTAQVFIPNPFDGASLALVTVEREQVMQYQFISLEGTGKTLSLPLTAEEAPNVYLSVTVIGRSSPADRPARPNEALSYDFRQGYINLTVKPVEQLLQVELTRSPERTGPGEEVTLSLRVTGADGQPVQGEFSLSVVDLAALALADPNSPPITTAFYGPQPLSIRNALDLVVDPERLSGSGGIGGGGGGAETPSVVRENFPDTAYWNAEIVTDANGLAQVSLALPDTLTTWKIEARGVTADTRVGQAESEVVATKDLLVRPVTPRFLVAGDHVLLAAVVQNNTQTDLEVDVSLQAQGFTLDAGDAGAAQRMTVQAGGRARVEWWGVAQDVSSVNLIFSAIGGGFRDDARPAQGALPVLRYISPQTFATAGYLEGEESQRLELISMPRSVQDAGEPAQGELRIELSPSLAVAMLQALDALERSPYQSTEETLSRFLPNLAVYQALQSFGIGSPETKERLERTLDAGLQRLQSTQNPDGGWGWWPAASSGEQVSDPYMTAYVLFGLNYAREAGAGVEAGGPDLSQTIQRAVDFLYNGLVAPAMSNEAWQLDRLAMVHFALASAGQGDPGGTSALYEVRDQLSPWAKALLALAIDRLSPGDARTGTLLSDLQAAAVRTATGVHWEDQNRGWQNLSTPVYTTAVVVYALAQQDPASPLLADAVRYLMAHRHVQGSWASSYETAWTLLGLVDMVQGTGELAAGFDFSASLNGSSIARGQAATSPVEIRPVAAAVPAGDLIQDGPNALVIHRDPGAGRLYYTAALSVSSPVESAAPLNQGITLSRLYYASAESREAVGSARPGELVTVRLTLALPNDAYYLVVEDYIPAGAEILDTSTKTSQQGVESEPLPLFDASNPFSSGWGWWYFHPAQVYDNRIAWAADYLPAGTYELTYTLVILQPGQYGVLPAHAWEYYFPEVQGSSAGTMFEIKPEE